MVRWTRDATRRDRKDDTPDRRLECGAPAGELEAARVELLGGLWVSVGARTVEEKERRLRKAGSLVKLLALAPEHRLHREQIHDLLWPALDTKSAANNLHRALHFARRVLEPASATATSRYLAFREDLLALCPGGPLRVDVEAFEGAAAAARRSRDTVAYRAAIDLYAGDLLPEDRYEPWAEDRRRELRTVYLALLVEMAALYEEQEEAGPAIEALQKVVAHERTHEEARSRLMRLYAITGRRREALLEYQRLQKALSEDLEMEPDATSRRLHEEILAGRFPRDRSPFVSRPPQEPRGAAGKKHNLPNMHSSFVGRQQEMVEVKRSLAMTGLLTLTGTGGCGKTRLALEVAKDLIGAYPDGVWLVELASLSDPALVPQTVASALGVGEQPGRSLTETLSNHLQAKQLLLVLDSCEHLIGACARIADTLLTSCEHLRILATSRETLGVAGETNWPVLPLVVPDVEWLPAVEDLTRYEAVRLFLDRARSKLPTFSLGSQNARAVARICRKLDGMPLAIELAAARVTALAVDQIAARFEDSLDPSGNRLAPRGCGEPPRSCGKSSVFPSHFWSATATITRATSPLRAGLDEAAFEAAWSEGRAMSPEQAIEYALETEAPAALEPEKRTPDGGSPDALTRRQLEVALLVAQGLTNRQVAAELVLSEHTVATHVREILRKLGLQSRTELAARVTEQDPFLSG